MKIIPLLVLATFLSALLADGPLITTAAKHRASQDAAGAIHLNVTVTDKAGHAMVGLEQSAFTVYDNDVVQDITSFENANQPLSVAIVYNMSSSVAFPEHQEEKQVSEVLRYALPSFWNASQNNQYFLMGYGQAVELLSDWTTDGTALLDKIQQRQAKDKTLLFDACYTAIEKLMREGKHKRVLLLLSNGLDDNSSHKLKDLTRLIKQSDVLVYSMGLMRRGDSGSATAMEGQGFLNEISSETGGQLYVPKKFAYLKDIFAVVALELSHQYTIGYRPSSFVADSKEHRVKIALQRVRGSDGKEVSVIVRVRQRYLANNGLFR